MTAAGILLTATMAVTCQFIQHTDPRFPLLYFTVDSAVLAAAVAAATLLRPQWRYLPALQATSGVAVVVSALVFAAVVAPATSTGTWIQPHDDYWVRTATILMHGVAPVLVSLGAPRLRLSRYIRYGYIWPVIYLVTLAALAAVGWVEVPYPFLQPSRIGWVGVTATLAALAATVAAVSGALWAISTLLPTTDRDVTTTRT